MSVVRIDRVTLTTASTASAAAFWSALGVPVEPSADAVEVRIGATRLRLAAAADAPPPHHLAITVPVDRFDEALGWLEERAVVLERDGARAFELAAAPWRSRSVYFDGPDGSVLELIARGGIPDRADGPFGPTAFLHVSEVGAATDDVPALVGALQDRGLPLFDGGGPDFAAVGDDRGLLILARTGRPWLPTADRRAEPAPILVEASGLPAAIELRAPTGLVLRGV